MLRRYTINYIQYGRRDCTEYRTAIVDAHCEHSAHKKLSDGVCIEDYCEDHEYGDMETSGGPTSIEITNVDLLPQPEITHATNSDPHPDNACFEIPLVQSHLPLINTHYGISAS